MGNYIARFARVSVGAFGFCVWALGSPAFAQHVIVGVDNKVYWDAEGKPVFSPPGKDAVLILDIADRLNPRIVGTLPLMNSVFGPPTNLAITPDESLALVATRWIGSRMAPHGKAFPETTSSSSTSSRI